MTPLLFAMLILAAYRLTRLATADTLLEPARRRLLLAHPDPIIVGVAGCGWCVGFWISGAVLAAAKAAGLTPGGPVLVLAWPAVAAAVGLLSEIA